MQREHVEWSLVRQRPNVEEHCSNPPWKCLSLRIKLTEPKTRTWPLKDAGSPALPLPKPKYPSGTHLAKRHAPHLDAAAHREQPLNSGNALLDDVEGLGGQVA
jgi:hypothetical protein